MANSMTLEVPLTQGYVAIIDAADGPRVLAHKWHAAVRPKDGKVYAARSEWPSRRLILMHRFLLNAKPGMEVHHKDDDGLHNCRLNLEELTHSEHQSTKRNTRRGRTNRFRGVTFYKRTGRFLARVMKDNRLAWSGYFDDDTTAAKHYDAAVRKLKGPRALTNFSET